MEKNDIERFERYCDIYNTICGIINEDDIDKIIKFYNIKISDKDKKDILLKKFKLVNGYYMLISSLYYPKINIFF